MFRNNTTFKAANDQLNSIINCATCGTYTSFPVIVSRSKTDTIAKRFFDSQWTTKVD